MKAAVLHAPNQPMTIEDIVLEKPKRREVLVRTAAAGLCHSDLHFIEGKYPTPVPVVLGHESAGVVEAVGDDVSYVKPGDHVITCLSVFCGHCEFCLSGHMSICQTPSIKQPPGPSRGLSWIGKPLFHVFNLQGFAEQMLVHENALVKVDREMPLDRAALIGCAVITGYGAIVHTARIEPGSTVAVAGCGVCQPRSRAKPWSQASSPASHAGQSRLSAPLAKLSTSAFCDQPAASVESEAVMSLPGAGVMTSFDFALRLITIR